LPLQDAGDQNSIAISEPHGKIDPKSKSIKKAGAERKRDVYDSISSEARKNLIELVYERNFTISKAS
jgi:hypothetical protein